MEASIPAEAPIERVEGSAAWRHTLLWLQGGLVAAAPLTPVFAGLFTVAAFLSPRDSTAQYWTLSSEHVLVPFGANLLLAWAILSLFWLVIGLTTAQRVNAGSYNALCARLVELRVRLAQNSPRATEPAARAACVSIEAHSAVVAVELATPGPGWVLGGEYLALWERIYRAEESLIRIAPVAELVAAAHYDRARCAGSSMENQVVLCQRLGATISYLRARPAKPSAEESPVAPESEDEARATLAMVRRAINDYREERWAGLVRARNHLSAATGLTGLTIYALLWLAILLGATAETIGLATAYYLVGSTVGFLNRLYSEARDGDAAAVDDYGLSLARLTVTPLLSGVAAIGGVLVVAMLALTQTGSTGAMAPSPSLVSFLDLGTHPFNVLIAATFGLTPGLLVDRLREQADSYRTDLVRSRATVGASAVASPPANADQSGRAAF